MIDSESFVIKGDASRIAAAIIAAADSPAPALRLVLGTSAFDTISAALEQSATAVAVQRDIAAAADRDDV